MYSSVFGHKCEYVLEVDLVVLAAIHDEVNLGLQLSILNVERNIFLLLLFFILVNVLHDVEETLDVAEGFVRCKLWILWDHLSLAGHNDASAIDQRLSRSCFAGWLLALVGTWIVESYQLFQEEIHSVHHILLRKFAITFKADKSRCFSCFSVLIFLVDAWEIILLLTIRAFHFKFSNGTVLQALCCLGM